MAGFGRAFGVVAVVAALLSPALAQQAEAEPWQEAITGQIEAFRTQDAGGAFLYAADGFHKSFPSAEAFFVAIVAAGYAPIMDSESHSFGTFQPMGREAVAQQVRFVGKDLSRYDAVYIMTQEAAGWRVQGVQLTQQPGISI